MGLLDKLGHAALDALSAVAARADEARTAARKPAAATPKPPAPTPTPKPPKRPRGPEPIGDAAIRAQVFGRMSCPWTQRALRLLTDRDVEHVYTDLAEPGGFSFAPRLKATTGQRTVPYVYLRGTFIGGYDALDEIDRLGQLDEMVKSDEERAASPRQNRTRIKIAPRQ